MTTTTVSSFPENWSNLFKIDQPLDMEAFQNSDLLAQQRKAYLKYSTATIVNGSISFIASLLLVLHILRSHDALSTTYHRLVFGLSICDILQSIGQALSATMVPKEMNYLAPFARGTSTTCDAEGMLFVLGGAAANLYNSSICFYYLAIIKYNKKDDFIREKLEKWFHIVSISLPVIWSIVLLVTKSYNGSNGAYCFVDAYEPPHCIGYERGQIPEGFSIPCGRGRYARIIFFALSPVVMSTPVVVFVTMTLMYRTVSTTENRIQRYGVGSLRLRTSSTRPISRLQPAETHDNRDNISPGISGYIKRWLIAFKNACYRQPNESTDLLPHVRGGGGGVKRKPATSKKRAVLYMAAGYAMAWSIAFTPFQIQYVTKSFHPVLIVMVGCTIPLQGLFNFMVFMAPKVRHAKTVRRGGMPTEISLGRAIKEAYLSRGDTRANGDLGRITTGSMRRSRGQSIKQNRVSSRQGVNVEFDA